MTSVKVWDSDLLFSRISRSLHFLTALVGQRELQLESSDIIQDSICHCRQTVAILTQGTVKMHCISVSIRVSELQTRFQLPLPSAVASKVPRVQPASRLLSGDSDVLFGLQLPG